MKEKSVLCPKCGRFVPELTPHGFCGHCLFDAARAGAERKNRDANLGIALIVGFAVIIGISLGGIGGAVTCLLILLFAGATRSL